MAYENVEVLTSVICAPFPPLPYLPPMKNYRIKKVSYANGDVHFYPQKKVFWLWKDLSDASGCCFRFYCELIGAKRAIEKDYKSSLKPIIEYLNLDCEESK